MSEPSTKPLSEHSQYVEWLESDDRKRARNWAVTYAIYDSHGEMMELRCEVLQWEDSNAKWYRLEPYSNREEAGCYFDVWLGGILQVPAGAFNARVRTLRPI